MKCARPRIWDFDGVIVDSFPLLKKINQDYLASIGRNVNGEFRMPKNVHDLFSSYRFGEKEMKDYFEYRSSEYAKSYASCQMFDGIKDIISNGEFKQGIYSDTEDRYIISHLEKNNILHSFLSVSGLRGRPKPDPAAFIECAKELDVDPRDVVLIGDTDVDISIGKRMGIYYIICPEYGGYSSNRPPGADLYVKTVAELRDALEEFDD